MTQEKTGPDATPRIGLDLGRQVLEPPSEDMIRQRAHEIWAREGRSGDPQDHWYRAERELSEAPQEQSESKAEDPIPGKASPGVAQVGNQKVPRPDKVSDRSVPDDIDE